MSLPTLTGMGRLIEDPALKYTSTGKALCKVRLAFNARRKNQNTGEWEDGDSCFITGTLFGDEAEHVAESLVKGDLVTVTGKLRTRKWTDDDGNKRSTTEMTVDTLGASTKYATVKVAKMDRSGDSDSTSDQGPAPDWATGTADIDF